jgi:UDP-N-acetylmuramate dehydrogenase
MIAAESLLAQLRQIPSLTVLPQEPLSAHTRFWLGGPCLLLADAASEPAYLAAHKLFASSGLPWTTIGGGTNLIVSDAGYPGAVLRYSAAALTREATVVTAGAGADLNVLIDFANAHGLAGIESMAGIPGWAGESVRFFDGAHVRQFTNAECAFRYRYSIFKDNKRWQILAASLNLKPGDADKLRARSAEIRATRDAKFPPTMRCAGSIFKNLLFAELPPAAQAAVPANRVIEGKVPAGWFLEQAGMKGFQRGGIHVASYHANLVYNDGSGTTAELVETLKEMKRRVFERYGLELEEEVQFVGFPSKPTNLVLAAR